MDQTQRRDLLMRILDAASQLVVKNAQLKTITGKRASQKDVVSTAKEALAINDRLSALVAELNANLSSDPDATKDLEVEYFLREILAMTAGAAPHRGSKKIPITYEQPAFKLLTISFDEVDPRFDGAEFAPIELCSRVNCEATEFEFEKALAAEKLFSTEELLTLCVKRAERPLLYEEGIQLVRKERDLLRFSPVHFDIVFLGSVAMIGGGRCVAAIKVKNHRLSLVFMPAEGPWSIETRIPVISVAKTLLS